MASVSTTTKSGVTTKRAAGSKSAAPGKIIGKATPAADVGEAVSTAKKTARPKVTPVRPAIFKIETVHEKHRYLKLLVYGDFGCGKTWLVSTAADVEGMRDVLMIDAEAGDMTLAGDGGKHHFDEIDTVRVTNYKEVSAVVDFLGTHCRLRVEIEEAKSQEAGQDAFDKLVALEAKFKDVDVSEIKTPRMYRTVIVDSLAEVESFCMYQLLGITDLTGLDEEVDAEEWSEYKKLNSMIQRMIRGLRNLPMHMLMTCPSKYMQDEKKRMLYTPAMTGQLSRKVQGFMDVVGYLVMGVPESDEAPIPRTLFVQPVKGQRFAAKCRFSTFKGSFFNDTTMGKILETVGLTSSITPKPKSKKGSK